LNNVIFYNALLISLILKGKIPKQDHPTCFKNNFLFRNSSKLLVSIFVLMVSCNGKKSLPDVHLKSSEQHIVTYAKRFNIEEKEGYSQVSIINPWQGSKDFVQTWYLIPRGEPIPLFIDTSEVIRVPVKRIICMSTTHIAMIAALNETRSVKGFSGIRFLFSGDLVQNALNSSLKEVGFEENLNKELILELEPELIMVYAIGGESAGYIGKLRELGIKILYNADYLETDPLGKAEWIKLIGLLYSKESAADSIFRTIENDYDRIKSYIMANVGERPKVLLGLPFKDTWYISPGNSYISKLIKDAGGEYLWQSTSSSVSMPVGLENVFIKALSADYWLNTGTADTPGQILSIDSRLAELPCFKKGNLFNNNKRVSTNGGNDYWEGGSLEPHIILNDIAAILHPDLFPDRELFYYKQVK
jgi:iron complex transport system substrate-binding protein